MLEYVVHLPLFDGRRQKRVFQELLFAELRAFLLGDREQIAKGNQIQVHMGFLRSKVFAVPIFNLDSEKIAL